VFCNIEVRKVLKHVSTRWLTLHKCLERVLNLWEGLSSYFLSHYDVEGEDAFIVVLHLEVTMRPSTKSKVLILVL
jgi:hypothetical protein